MSVYLNQLNPPQREAVDATDGALLVLAGAGSGKTRVITCRVAYLVEKGVDPANILTLTFTNKAAREMKARVAGMLPVRDADKVTASTFHALCARILRRQIVRLGYTSDYDIAPQGYQVGLVQSILSEQGLIHDRPSAATYLNFISRTKSALLAPADVAGDDTALPKQFVGVYESYQKSMKRMNMVDFDDLLFLTATLWREHPDILELYQNQYNYIMVDEYQDTNAAQFELLSLLAAKSGNICAVGDDDQSIYGWRGADIRNILRFEEHFPGCKVISLEQNYRSTTTILEAANSLIARNSARHAKKLWSDKGEGRKIRSVHSDNELGEAQFIGELFRDRHAQRSGRFSDFAVLYRSNHQSRAIEEVFRKMRIPYQVVGSKSFYQRREILDAVSFLRIVHNPEDDLAVLRVINVPPRGIGESTLERLREMQKATGLSLMKIMADAGVVNDLPQAARRSIKAFQECIQKFRGPLRSPHGFADNVHKLWQEIGYLDGLGRMYKPREDALRRRENVLEFINRAAEFAETTQTDNAMRDFLEQFSLLDDQDKVDDESDEARDAVTMLTVHAAKGLEFPVVAVAGMEQNLFPHERSIKDRALEEERRLFYVAMTRAREELVLTRANRRRLKGRPISRRPACFLAEISEEYVIDSSDREALEPASPDVASDYIAQMKAMFSGE
ncbi:MAG: UvrD-helicase domain-containing protein [Lentisphaeria bacterium]